jgi:hypothetical protein
MLFLLRTIERTWGDGIGNIESALAETLLTLCGDFMQGTDEFNLIHGNNVRRMQILAEGQYRPQARSCLPLITACEEILSSIHTILASCSHPLFDAHMHAVINHKPRAIEFVVVGPGASGQRWHGDTRKVSSGPWEWFLRNVNIFIMLSNDRHESTRMLRPGLQAGYSSFVCKQGDLWVCPSDYMHAGAPNATRTDRVVLFISYGERSLQNVHFAQAPFDAH